MFLIRAFLNLNIINIVVTLFYLHRGLTLSQIFYLSIVWSVAMLLFEVPSSYLADKWGRKKIIILGVILNLAHLLVYIFANNIVIFIISIIFMAMSYAAFSGTDDALIYDTNKELKRSKDSLKELGKYYSARSFFKIVTPLIGAIVAYQLLEWQFVSLIILDLLFTFSTLIIALRLVEPNHIIDVVKQEAGIIKDAYKVIRNNKCFVRAIFSRMLLFIASFILWRFHQKFFIDIGVPIIILGAMWSLTHLALFLINQNIKKILPKKSSVFKINWLNFLTFLSLFVMVILVFYYQNIYLLLIVYFLANIFEVIRWSYFSDYFNKMSFSYNRATTLSLSNFLKSILDIPLLFIASILIDNNINYPFVLALILSFIVVVFFRVKNINRSSEAK